MIENSLNYKYKVDTQDELTFKNFSLACMSAMTEDTHTAGILGLPTSSTYVLFAEGRSSVCVRNWSNMLSLSVCDAAGHWLINSHVDGYAIDDMIRDAWSQYLNISHLVTQEGTTFKGSLSNLIHPTDPLEKVMKVIMTSAIHAQLQNDETTECCPLSVIMFQTGMNKYQVQKATKLLRNFGYINLVHSTIEFESGKRHVAGYVLTDVGAYRYQKQCSLLYLLEQTKQHN